MFVATYFLYVAINRKLGPQKTCHDKISICRDIIQLEHRQNCVVTVFCSVATKNCPNSKLSENLCRDNYFSMLRHSIKQGVRLYVKNLSRQLKSSWPINRKV